MEKINRIKGALADVGQTGKWLAEQLEKILQLYRSDVLIVHSLIYRHSIK